MTGTQVMVLLIVAMVMLASVVKSKNGYRRRHGHDTGGEAIADAAEARQLRDEVKQLKERLAVLEQITVEKENSLSREIEQLRDR